ncbi:hypothetical protein BDP55DRAFT_292059 [Colletotrichum godetiae]|uniref:Secreted protein n=1 Tax=Colletotrichum godetiae TaxID=1209918 RepID=A0AAJ0AGZ2_9PEZI|nr:uncharacterized protein BDP55DRAFT_292059 [Colletotrichum godetiae]KAK1671521.1 hypothetical protein BDP55DRAFT_292059 [Colletotrichum godetiae]
MITPGCRSSLLCSLIFFLSLGLWLRIQPLAIDSKASGLGGFAAGRPHDQSRSLTRANMRACQFHSPHTHAVSQDVFPRDRCIMPMHPSLPIPPGPQPPSIPLSLFLKAQPSPSSVSRSLMPLHISNPSLIIASFHRGWGLLAKSTQRCRPGSVA